MERAATEGRGSPRSLGPRLERSAPGGDLVHDGVDLAALARELETPLYSYSAGAVDGAYRAWCRAFEGIGFGGQRHWCCFAVKANGALALLHQLHGLGAGFDIVSSGELRRVLEAGGRADRVVFSGPGKGCQELGDALDAGVGLINVETPLEARRLAEEAGRRGAPVDVGLRLNPDLDPGTHPFISTGPRRTKFGLTPDELADVAAATRGGGSSKGLRVRAVATHIGSQIGDLAPLVEAARQAREAARSLRADGHPVEWLDIGGGLAVSYGDEGAPTPADLAEALQDLLSGWPGGLITEPGRSIVAAAGVLVVQVVAVRPRGDRLLVICDAGMNALVRPALYGARHRVVAVRGGDADRGPGSTPCDVLGPLCETGDVLARDVPLDGIGEGDLLAILDAGAYGFAMASEYNTRPRPIEVRVEDGRHAVIRRRQSIDELLAPERLAHLDDGKGT